MNVALAPRIVRCHAIAAFLLPQDTTTTCVAQSLRPQTPPSRAWSGNGQSYRSTAMASWRAAPLRQRLRTTWTRVTCSPRAGSTLQRLLRRCYRAFLTVRVGCGTHAAPVQGSTSFLRISLCDRTACKGARESPDPSPQLAPALGGPAVKPIGALRRRRHDGATTS